jgi:outer membrane protein assembly factor BamB
VQGQPFSLTSAFSGGLGNIVLVGSQDGRVYCFNADTGAQIWMSASFGVVQARPMVMLRAAGYPGSKDLVLFGTRNASAGNQVVALDLANGDTLWSFTGGGGVGDGTFGIVSGPLSGRPSASRVYFTSRSRFASGGSDVTLWAINVTDATATFAWGLALGDIDGSPTFHATTGNVLVGNNSGDVYSITTAGAQSWVRSLGDGPVKEFVVHDATRARIYLATTNTVWAIPDTGAGAAWTQAASAPTRPVLQFNTARVYVGACAASCADGRLYELDGTSGTGWTVKTLDVAGAGGLGSVVIDRNPEPDILHSGSRSGRIVAVAIPLP